MQLLSLNLTPKLTSEEKRKQSTEKVKKSHEKTQLSQEVFFTRSIF